MIRELSDGDPAPLKRQVPKYVKLAMFEGKYGFYLQPVCIITHQKIEVARIKIPDKKRTMLEAMFAGEETWQVQVWEYAEGYDSPTPTWMITFDPETTYEEACQEADKVRKLYVPENWKNAERVSQMFRPADPRISLAPEKPPISLAKEDPQLAIEINHHYETLREQRAARFQVLKVILPKTIELVEKAEQTADDDTRQQLEKESLEAFFAENAPGWSPIIFKAWQQLNPIGLKWFEWLYIWKSRQIKHRKEINAADYEMAFNWCWKKYYLLTAEQMRDEIKKETKQLFSAEALKKRRERLGLTTQRPTGPPPKSSGQ